MEGSCYVRMFGCPHISGYELVRVKKVSRDANGRCAPRVPSCGDKSHPTPKVPSNPRSASDGATVTVVSREKINCLQCLATRDSLRATTSPRNGVRDGLSRGRATTSPKGRGCRAVKKRARLSRGTARQPLLRGEVVARSKNKG